MHWFGCSLITTCTGRLVGHEARVLRSHCSVSAAPAPAADKSCSVVAAQPIGVGSWSRPDLRHGYFLSKLTQIGGKSHTVPQVKGRHFSSECPGLSWKKTADNVGGTEQPWKTSEGKSQRRGHADRLLTEVSEALASPRSHHHEVGDFLWTDLPRPHTGPLPCPTATSPQTPQLIHQVALDTSSSCHPFLMAVTFSPLRNIRRRG